MTGIADTLMSRAADGPWCGLIDVETIALDSVWYTGAVYLMVSCSAVWVEEAGMACWVISVIDYWWAVASPIDKGCESV